ncbi:MAG: acetyltransferase [Gammaproteobacteria bacterium]|jgi:sugar O-acyltransferase (sialic acid O-acetyltransferase NeuD family)|nr:acetyltransferase [Gammaproteobacteria bacterium]
MKKLAIVGASGHGKVVGDTAECAGWNDITFFDDAWPDISVNGKWRLKGTFNDLLENLEDYEGIVVAIGDNLIRFDKSNELIERGANLVSIIHPTAYISRFSRLGTGSVLFANTVVNTDTSIGIAAIINTSSSIDHDCELGDGVHISPGVNLAGGVIIGDLSWIGIGACVRQYISIGERVIVGTGAAVINNISDDLTVAGVPAIPINK